VAALCGSVNYPPEAEPEAGGRKRSPACSLPLVRFPSPSEVWVSRVAPFLASGAPPSPFGTAAGSSSAHLLSGLSFRESSRGVQVLSRVPSSPCRPSPVSVRTAWAVRTFARAGSASPGLLAPGTPRPRAPRSPRDTLFTRVPWRARSANSSPVPSSGLVPSRRIWLLREPFGPREEPANLSRRPEASRPCFMPLAFLGVSLQSFPLSGSRSRSRGPLLPCGFAFDDCQRGPGKPFTPLSPSRRPIATVCREAHRTTGPWRRFPALLDRTVARAFARRPRTTACSSRARRWVAGTPASKLCSPRESVRAAQPPWPGWTVPGRCSHGILPL